MGAEQSLRRQLLPDGATIPSWIISSLPFLSEQDLFAMLSLSSKFATFGRDDRFFKEISLNLRYRGVYVPAKLPLSERSWKTFYLELHTDVWADSVSVPPATDNAEADKDADEARLVELRDMHSSQKASTPRFRINVYARFRPHEQPPAVALKGKETGNTGTTGGPDENSSGSHTQPSSAADEDKTGTECVLPLHQRLRLIRMSGAKTQREALRTLAAEGDWFSQKWAAVQQQAAHTAAASNDPNVLVQHESCPLKPQDQPLTFTRAKGQPREAVVAKVRNRNSCLHACVCARLYVCVCAHT